MLDQILDFITIFAQIVTNPLNLVVLVASSLLGIVFGSLPGLTATLGVALLTTLTYNFNTDTALISLLGAYVGAIYGGSYPAILINIPGTPASAASAQDGYPLAQRGEGGRALGMTTTASALGTLFGLMSLVLISPTIASFALQFTSWEFFLLALFGIILSGTLTGGDQVIKGWVAGLIGLFLAMIGRDTLQFFPRYTFGLSQLDSGLEIVPVLIGAFGVPQVIKVLSEPRQVIKPGGVQRVSPQFAQIGRNLKHIFRSAMIGVGIGAVPGVGEDMSGWVSYGAAKRSSSPEQKAEFGKGSSTGLISSETANNACVGGAMIPLLTLGIPGSPPAAMLLGALMLHGIAPGPTIEIDHPGFFLEITAIMMIATIAMWVNGMVLSRVVIRILSIPSSLLIPVIAVLCVVGGYALGLSLFNLYLMFPIGLIAFILIQSRFPIAPLVIGLVLGTMADESLRRALMISDGSFLPMFQRPVCLVLIAVIGYFIISNAPGLKRAWPGRSK